MASKKKLADEAYHNAEAQRALVVVLAAAHQYASDQLDGYDELEAAIERVKATFLRVTAPEPAKTLAGQIDLVDGSVEGEVATDTKLIDGVPEFCPGCGRNMIVAHGGSWSVMYRALTSFPPRLQCGFCSHAVTVTEEAYEHVRRERRRAVGASDVLTKKVDSGKKVRGAG